MSGAHLNPVVSLADRLAGGLSSPELAAYVAAQLTGAVVGLLLVIAGVVCSGHAAAPFPVGAYIGSAYFFTASTSFANPAVTIGRTLTDTFTGIAPASAPAFVAAQLVGAVVAVGAIRILHQPTEVEW